LDFGGKTNSDFFFFYGFYKASMYGFVFSFQN
jgi:hypothetical protein